jgi:predicted nucleic acid-binding protein
VSYLLDTNVLSEIRKGHRDSSFSAWYTDIGSTELYLSAIVIGEIAQGIARLELRRDIPQASLFERWLSELKHAFEGRVLPVSTAIAERWGRLNGARPLPVVDGLLAATALEHDLTLVTRDDTALSGTGVRLLNPWAEKL